MHDHARGVRPGRAWRVPAPEDQGSSLPLRGERASLRAMPASTTWRENVAPDEAARFERYAEELRAMQRARAKGRPARRALHAKGQLGLEAELTVLPDLPEAARQSFFATPGSYRAYVRYSNGSGGHQADRKPDVRGIAVKVLGVPGKKLIPGLEDASTQDFLLIHSPRTPVRDADEFLSLVRAAASPALLPVKLLSALGVRRGLSVLRDVVRGISTPVPSLATKHYYSALPLRFGPYAAKLALAPLEPPAPGARPGSSADYLGEELAARLRRGPVRYELKVQLYVDDAKTPIEDSSVEWREADAPYITVAQLTLPTQDPSSERGRKIAAFVEQLSFDPWHAREDLRPLGNMMRARNHAYRASTEERKAAGEPDGSERFD